MGITWFRLMRSSCEKEKELGKENGRLYELRDHHRNCARDHPADESQCVQSKIIQSSTACAQHWLTCKVERNRGREKDRFKAGMQSRN
ncbi:hypothetical protein TgHK011_009127 [Trichoderma gracile]|nr:hypothetical protein TgHK011_009127 [Trichoderma gracile]